MGENELKVLSCWNRITKREKKGQVLRFISNIFASQKLGFGKVLLYQINLFWIKPFLKRFDVSILVLVDLSLRPQRLPLLYPFFSCLVAPFLHHLFTYIFYFTPYKYMLSLTTFSNTSPFAPSRTLVKPTSQPHVIRNRKIHHEPT